MEENGRPLASSDLEAAMCLIERILCECPQRPPASQEEYRAQLILKKALEAQGLRTELIPFRFNTNLYANLALHFGIGTAGALLFKRAPWMSALLQGLAGVSYLADSTRQGYLLRRLLPFKASQNLLATLPAQGTPTLRIVVVGHADAAYTGALFHPEVVKRATPHNLPPSLQFFGRSLAVATYSQLAGAGLSLVRLLGGFGARGLWPVAAVLSVPGIIALLANLDIVWRNEVVPGANDNLTGAAAVVALAGRFAEKKPAEVEMVFVVTGCEEAGTGGAYALAERQRGVWEPYRTVILGLDGLSNGTLRYFEEGEIISVPTPGWLKEILTQVAGSDPRFASVEEFKIPSGATDVMPFRAKGFEGVALGCVDPELGAPRHYHRPTDTLANLDSEQLGLSIDFTEALIDAIIRVRT